MTNESRVLKAIDKNSLPNLLDIIEVPREKEPPSTSKKKKNKTHGSTHGLFSVPSNETREAIMTSSKTPKISNCGGNQNATTRKDMATARRPPKRRPPVAKKRSSLGNNILTPLKNTKRLRRIPMSFGSKTPPRTPGLKRHYDRLQPSARRLDIPSPFAPQATRRSAVLLRKKNIESNVTLRFKGSSLRNPNGTIKRSGLLSATPERAIDTGPHFQEKRTNPDLIEAHRETKSHNHDDDMNCDSSDSFSMGSLSSSSPPKSPLPVPTSNPAMHDSSRHKDTTAVLARETRSLRTTQDSSSNAQNKGFQIVVPKVLVKESSVPDPIRDATIEDPNVFKLMMNSTKKHEMDNELLGFTIGYDRFIQSHLEDYSDVTVMSSIDYKTSSEELPNNKAVQATYDPSSDYPIMREEKAQQIVAQTPHQPMQPCKEEERIEGWFVHGQSNSPFFFEIDGKKYGHPALPPGWKMRISETSNQPVYTHPDHGSTWHCPVKLTPNMVYVKTNEGQMIRRNKSSVQRKMKSDDKRQNRNGSSKDYASSSRIAQDGRRRRGLQTPPSARDPSLWRNETASSGMDVAPPDQSPSNGDDDHDSTYGLMQEISQLSVRLMKNSSSNLQKVEEVKLLHEYNKKTTKSPLAEEEYGEATPVGLKCEQVSNRVSYVDTQSSMRKSEMYNEGQEQRSFSDSESKSPSTMSGLIHQYERRQNREGLGSNGEQKDFPPRDSQNQNAFMASDECVNQGSKHSHQLRKPPSARSNIQSIYDETLFPMQRIGVHGRQQLSPIRESLEPNDSDNTVDEMTRGDGEEDLYFVSGTNATQMAISKGNTRQPLSDIPTCHGFANDTHQEAILGKRKQVTKQISFPNTPYSDGKTIPSSHFSQKSNQTKQIKPWFPPSLEVGELKSTMGDNTDGDTTKDIATFKLAVTRRNSRLQVGSAQKMGPNESIGATPSVAPRSTSPGGRCLQASPILYDDEWSPLVQPRSTGSQAHYGDQGNHDDLSMRPFQQSNEEKGLKPSDTNVDTERTPKECTDTPREIQWNVQHSSAAKNNEEGPFIRTSPKLKPQEFLAADEMKKSSAIPRSEEKIGTQNDAESSVGPVESDVDIVLLTGSDSGLKSTVGSDEQMECDTGEVPEVTVEVHAHSAKQHLPRVAISFSPKSESFESFGPNSPNVEGNNRFADDKSKRNEDANSIDNDSGIGFEICDDNVSVMSKESLMSAKGDSHGGDENDEAANNGDLGHVPSVKMRGDAMFSSSSTANRHSNSRKLETAKESVSANPKRGTLLKQDDPIRVSNRTLETEFTDEESTVDSYRKSRNEYPRLLKQTKGPDSPMETEILDNSKGPKHHHDHTNVEQDEIESTSRSFGFADSDSDGNESSLGLTTFQTDSHPVEDEPREKFRSRRSNGTTTASSRADQGRLDRDDLTTDSEVESPVQPTVLGKQRTSYKRPGKRGNTVEDADYVVSGSYYYKLSWRILNPPFPICSLQRLDEFASQQKRTKPKRSNRGRQVKRRTPPTQKRRKTRSRVRR